MKGDATSDDIKKAYHALVHYFHPDKNQDSPFAAAYFLEIQEAYEVLSVSSARRAYDKERSFTFVKHTVDAITTPVLLLQQAQKLADDVRRIAVYRIDIAWLTSALAYLLSTERVVVLMPAELKETRMAFLQEIVFAMNILQYPLPIKITCGISVLVENDKDAKAAWERVLLEKQRNYQFKKSLPWIAVIMTVSLCLLMYWYGKN